MFKSVQRVYVRLTCNQTKYKITLLINYNISFV